MIYYHFCLDRGGYLINIENICINNSSTKKLSEIFYIHLINSHPSTWLNLSRKERFKCFKIEKGFGNMQSNTSRMRRDKLRTCDTSNEYNVSNSSFRISWRKIIGSRNGRVAGGRVGEMLRAAAVIWQNTGRRTLGRGAVEW